MSLALVRMEWESMR